MLLHSTLCWTARGYCCAGCQRQAGKLRAASRAHLDAFLQVKGCSRSRCSIKNSYVSHNNCGAICLGHNGGSLG